MFPSQRFPRTAKPRRPWRWVIAGAALLLLVLIIARCGKDDAPTPPTSTATRVEVMTLSTRPVTDRLLVTGTLAARHELPISSELSGLRILRVHVEEGDWVKANQPLLTLDTALLQAELAQRQAAVSQQEAAQQEAESYLRRLKPLEGTGAVSAQEMESRAASATSANANLQAARAQLNETQTRLRQAEIKAPRAGIVGQRAAEPGQLTAAGGSPLFRIIENGEVELYAQVPEADLAKLSVGQSAFAWVGESREGGQEGKIRLIRPLVDAQTRLGLVRIALPKNPAFRVGAFARAEVTTGQREALAAPLSAITYEDGRPLLTLVNADNKVSKRAVTLGAREDNAAEIVEGASPGDRIVARAATFLREGDTVTPVDAAEAVPAAPAAAQ